MALQLDFDGVDPLTLNLVRRVCLGDLPTRAARQFGDRIAIIDGAAEVTYRDLENRANSLARGLLEFGLTRGDVVCGLMANRWEFLVTFFACAKIGAVMMPTNTGLSADDIGFQIANASPRLVVVEREFLPLLEASLAEAGETPTVERIVVVGHAPEAVGKLPTTSFSSLIADNSTDTVETVVEDRDVAQCLYTSGTTSRPKAVLTSHTAVMMAALSTCIQFRHERGDSRSVFPIVLPLFHVTALNTLTLPVLLTGGTVVLHRRFDAQALRDDIAVREVTHLMLLPNMWGDFVASADGAVPGGDSVRMAIYAMAPMNEARLKQIRVVLPNADVVLGSGQTEFTPPTVMQWPSHQWDRSGSWGAAVATADVQIMSHDGALLGPGEQGEIVYRGSQSMQGYGNRPGANAEVFAHGWFHSGDVGYLDADGVLWFTDRIKDIVKTGGENVSSVEVERVLLGHPAVADCAVVGLPDNRWGEAVTAVVVPTDGQTIDENDLRTHAREHLAAYKVPKQFIVVAELPRTSTGKIRKQKLREQHITP